MGAVGYFMEVPWALLVGLHEVSYKNSASSFHLKREWVNDWRTLKMLSPQSEF
jgi:hypothetical protein